MKRICLVPFKVKLVGNRSVGENLNNIPKVGGRSSLEEGNANLMSVVTNRLFPHPFIPVRKDKPGRSTRQVHHCLANEFDVHYGL
jgi:hypothetical protein